MLIINADDFGLNAHTSKAIIQAFRKGLCSSTTIMPNMPSFEEASQLYHENKLRNHTGLHLVLDEGCPLTEKIKRFHKCCNNKGQLCLSRERPIFDLETTEKMALAEEIRAQIRRCKAYKIPITHIDSHHHIHTEWGIAMVLMPILREEGIPYIRISRNFGPRISLYKRIYKNIINYKFKIASFARTKYFGSIGDFIFLKKHKDTSNIIKSCEIMVHPSLNDRGDLIDDINKDMLEKIIKEIDLCRNAVSFNGAKYL